MNLADWVLAATAIAYGILAIIGGIIGYRKVQSKVSLISGSISGSLLVLMGVLLQLGQSWAFWGAIAITALLVLTFIVRLLKTRKFMPAGLMGITGILVLLVLLQPIVFN
ncbi:MAG: TMEM14 family protein [Cyanobacteria bacterium P01_G01_bin.54]